MDNGTITPVMPVGDGFGGGSSFMWIFALLILMFGMGGGFGFGGNQSGVNTLNADMQRGFDNQNLQAQTRDILGAVTNGTAQSVAATVGERAIGNVGANAHRAADVGHERPHEAVPRRDGAFVDR